MGSSSSPDLSPSLSDDEEEQEALEAHHFLWHTPMGLLEGLASHYEEEAYMNKSIEEQIDLLVKKYTPTQLKLVIVSTCFHLTRDPKDLDLKAITSKNKAGLLLKELILPALDEHESDVHSGVNEKR